MKILWLTWKDYTHPEAGGAEVVLRELSAQLTAEGHEVTFLTVRHKGSAAREEMDGIEVIRVGTSRYLHPFQALAYYVLHMRNRYDIVIEVVNTVPYFSALFKDTAQTFIFYHQMARDVWFFEAGTPLNRLGYHCIEPVATWLMSRSKAPLITISQSTLNDLKRFGFRKNASYIISEGIEIQPVRRLEQKKFNKPTMLSLGALRAMKRTIDQIKAFEIAKRSIPDLQLIVAGDYRSDYGRQVIAYARRSPWSRSIRFEGKVSRGRKEELMRKCHILTMTSIKEGWGLIVTEAASQGTPTIVYDVDGLRDSVRHQRTGLITAPTPGALAAGIHNMLQNQELYEELRRHAWEWSKQITFEHSYNNLKSALGIGNEATAS